MRTPEAFKKHAAECEALARKTTDPADKEKLLEMAAAWLRFAERIEKKQEGSDGENSQGI